MLENKTYYKNAVKSESVMFVGPQKMYYLNDLEYKILNAKTIPIDGIEAVWSYKHFILKSKKFCSTNTKGDSARCCNSVAEILSKYYSITEIILIMYKSGKSEALVFCNPLQVETFPGFEKTKSVLRVKGSSETTCIFQSRLIENCKFIKICDDN